MGLNSLGFVTDERVVDIGEDNLFARLNFIWDGAVNVQEALFESDKELRVGLCDGGLLLDGNMDKIVDLSYYGKDWVSSNAANELEGCSKIHLDGVDSASHNAWFFFTLLSKC